MMTKIKRASLVDETTAYLQKQIIVGALHPESRLQEQRLAQELDVSRGTIREAMPKLEQVFLVTRINHKGISVSPFDQKWVHDVMRSWQSLSTAVLENSITTVQADIQNFKLLVTQQNISLHQQQDRNGKAQTIVSIIHEYLALNTNPILGRLLKQLLPAVQRCVFSLLTQPELLINAVEQYLKQLADALLKNEKQRIQQDTISFCETLLSLFPFESQAR